jgi:hypothetical protein
MFPNACSLFTNQIYLNIPGNLNRQQHPCQGFKSRKKKCLQALVHTFRMLESRNFCPKTFDSLYVKQLQATSQFNLCGITWRIYRRQYFICVERVRKNGVRRKRTAAGLCPSRIHIRLDNGSGLLVASLSPPHRTIAVHKLRHRRQMSAF